VRDKSRRPLHDLVGMMAALASVALPVGCGDPGPATTGAGEVTAARRAALAAALDVVPGDAALVAGVVVAEIRAAPDLATSLRAVARAVDARVAAGCAIDWAARTEWVLVALGDAPTVVATGDWSRGDVERCVGAVRWRDARTFVVGAGGGAPGPVVRAAAGTDRHATAWLAADERHLDALPAPAIATAQAWLVGSALTATALVTPANPAEADAITAVAEAALTRLRATPGASLLGTIQLGRRGPALEARAWLAPAAVSTALARLASPGDLVR
jgi:hypothetical protein